MKIALSVAEMAVGGIATFILNLGEMLCHKGHHVTVVAQRPGEWWSALAERGLKGHLLVPKPWDSVASQAKRLAAYVVDQKFDLMVVNIGIDNCRAQRCLYALPNSLAVMLVLHNNRPEVYDLAAINVAAWNCAVGVSPRVKQTAANRFPQKPIEFIPYGINLPSRITVQSRVAWELPLRLLFVGRLVDHQKGIFRLPAIITACRQQNLPVRLTVLGDGPDAARLGQMFVEQGVADWVKMCGFQPNESVAEMMRTHHLLLMPSNFEGLSIVIQEAQANGCVPIAARLLGGMETMIADGSNGLLVDPTDLPGFVDAIGTCMNADHWQRYSQAAIQHAQQQYAVHTMNDRYLALFEAIQQGAYALPVDRSVLRKQGLLPLTWGDYLPQPLRTRFYKYAMRMLQKL